MRHRLLLAALLLVSCSSLFAEPPLTPEAHFVPGADGPTPLLRYQDPAATNVEVAGSWDRWEGRYPMRREEGLWTLDSRSLGMPFGRHEYKFIVNDEWEKGDNRHFHANAEGEFEKPPAIIQTAQMQDSHTVEVFLARAVPEDRPLKVWLEPSVPVSESRLASPAEAGHRQGYAIVAGLITFYLDEKTYGLDLPPSARVVVAGNFTGWDGGGGGGRWVLHDPEDDNVWTLSTQLAGLRGPAGEKDLLFKFVIDQQRWLSPPERALNATSDGKGNVNLRIDSAASGSTSLKITTAEPLDLSRTYVVAIDGLLERTVRAMVTPGRALDLITSDKPLGVILDRAQGATTYRLFAPRATEVYLCLYDTPEYEVHEPEYQRLPPAERYLMWKDPADGVWEISLLGLDIGRYYSFNVDGPAGDGEGFNPLAQIGDPYARAAAFARNNTIVVDPDETNAWFGGWTDAAYVPAPMPDVVIYECHVRGMTMHPSSGVAPALRGKYEGLLATLGTGTGLDHLKDLGVTTIELLPTVEFNGNPDEYNWGYAPVFYFAPEASYGRRPLKGSQYHEFKRLVDGLHNAGFGVVLDVVFNHVGSPNIFHMLDKKYYFRLNPDYTYSNFSGCGNDVRTEAPMMRRLIVDNIVYWMKEFRVDGFRFDLAELIDMDTMLAIRDAARAINPNVLLISEPWSFRGENKRQLTGTGWSAWNNDFRYAAKDFAMGRRNRDWLKKNIAGSLETWAADPLQPVNYLESHDDMALADELCTRPDRDGRSLQEMDVSANRLAATVLFTSLGIPMIHEGQEFLRSKRGIHNTYNRGDEVNAVRWTDRERPLAAETLAYYRGLIRLRASPQGAAFRLREKPPANYFHWITPPDERLFGYVVNAGRARDGAAFVVLLNAGGEDADFAVNFPAGTWRIIGNGKRIEPAGLPGTEPFAGSQTRTVRVLGLHAAIFMDGFGPATP